MKLEDIRKLHQKKFREEFGHFLVEGEHVVQELEKAAQRDARLRASTVYVTHEYSGSTGRLPREVINARHMAQITEMRSPQGIAAVVPLLGPAPPRAGERAVYLWEIQDPGNLGTILRTLAWFGNFRCLLSPDSVDVHNGKVVRASMGAVFHVPVEHDVPLEALRGRFRNPVSLDLAGAPITASAFGDGDCYLFGNEARGLPRSELQALGARAFTIPGVGSIESLNVATSVSLCAYELARRFVADERQPEAEPHPASR